MNNLINDIELGLPISTPSQRAIMRAVKWATGINKLNRFYASLDTTAAVPQFVSDALEKLDVKYNISQNSLDKIPAEGGAIVVCNYPHGGVDGLLILDALFKRRADVKVLGNFILSQIHPVNQAITSVDTTSKISTGTISGLRAARRHVMQGGILAIFPATNVSTFQQGFSNFNDSKWNLPLIKFIASHGVPVTPIYISGRNSLFFHITHKVHHRLSSIRLIGELFNKRGSVVDIEVGEPLSYSSLSTLASLEQWRQVLSANISLLRTICRNKERETFDTVQPASIVEVIATKKPRKAGTQPLWPKALWPDKQESITREVESLPRGTKIASLSTYELYFASTDDLTDTSTYIESLRTESNDKHNLSYRFNGDEDPHTHYLFCWDKTAKRVASGVRVGFGDEIFDLTGVDGFYCHSYFEFSHKFLPVLRRSIEIGSWVIADDYRLTSEAQWMLWRGGMTLLTRSDSYSYLLGMTTICESRSLTARKLITTYVHTHHYRKDFERQIIARQPIRSMATSIFDVETMHTLNQDGFMTKFVRDADPSATLTTPMLQRYIQSEGQAIAFNVSSRTQHTICALMMIDGDKFKDRDLQLFHVEQ